MKKLLSLFIVSLMLASPAMAAPKHKAHKHGHKHKTVHGMVWHGAKKVVKGAKKGVVAVVKHV